MRVYRVVPDRTARVRVERSAVIEEEHMEQGLEAFAKVSRDLELI
jgi:hypothetical protein